MTQTLTVDFATTSFTFGGATLRQYIEDVLPALVAADIPALKLGYRWLEASVVRLTGMKANGLGRNTAKKLTWAKRAFAATVAKGQELNPGKCQPEAVAAPVSQEANPCYPDASLAQLAGYMAQTTDPVKAKAQATAMALLTLDEVEVTITTTEQMFLDMANAMNIDLGKLSRI